jgi:hypothetical protein
MNPWLETTGVTLVVLGGIFLGRMFSGLRRPYWAFGYFISLVFVAILVAARYIDSLAFVPPFSLITAGRAKLIILALAATTGLTTPLSRLPYKFEKVITHILMAAVVTYFSILPFLLPALTKNHLLNLKTRVNSNGICFQTKDYTCGPAAAVTALRKLGFQANEGEIAVLSHTSPILGTLPDCLSAALQSHYKADGLKCRYRHFDSLAELRDAGITLAVVKDGFLSSHCVTVLEVSEQMVSIADPVIGRKSMSHGQFEKIWRFSGIVLKRDSTQSI